MDLTRCSGLVYISRKINYYNKINESALSVNFIIKPVKISITKLMNQFCLGIS